MKMNEKLEKLFDEWKNRLKENGDGDFSQKMAFFVKTTNRMNKLNKSGFLQKRES